MEELKISEPMQPIVAKPSVNEGVSSLADNMEDDAEDSSLADKPETNVS